MTKMKFSLTFEGEYDMEETGYKGTEPDEWIAEDEEVIMADPITFLESCGEVEATLTLEVID